jgi:uncharacterized protein YqeY
MRLRLDITIRPATSVAPGSFSAASTNGWVDSGLLANLAADRSVKVLLIAEQDYAALRDRWTSRRQNEISFETQVQDQPSVLSSPAPQQQMKGPSVDTSPTLAQIKTDWMTARKARNTDLADFLGTVSSEASRPGRDQVPPRDSTEDEVQEVLKATLKNLNVTRDKLVEAGRTNEPVFAKTENEITVITAYRPKMIDEGVIEGSLRFYIKDNPYGEDAPGSSMRSMKPMLKYLSEKYPDQYNASAAASIAKKIIAENAG